MSKVFPYGIKAPQTIPKVADMILDEYFEVMGELDIRGCLAYGLCLGFVRDGGYIKGDNDLDVVVLLDDKATRDKLHVALSTRGYLMGGQFPPPDNNSHYVRDNILLDIFIRKPEGLYKEFGSVTYKGKEYPVPHPVEDYLAACYKDWTTKLEEQGEDGRHGV